MQLPGLIRFIARFYAQVWHRVMVVGEKIPGEGPTIVVANHTSGVMDGALVYGWCPRHPRMLVKFSILSIPGLASLAKLSGAIPVYRKKDNLPTEMNMGAFAVVRETLGRGESLIMFPEGESKTTWHLRVPLRTGAARMALDTEDSQKWKLGLRILPIGVHYSDRDTYRSRVDMRVGESFEIRSFEEIFTTDGRKAVRLLNERIAEALAEVSLQVACEEDVPVLRLARRCWHSPDGSHHARLQAAADGLVLERTIDPQACQTLVQRAVELEGHLEEVGVDPIFAQTQPPPSERTGSPLASVPYTVSRFFWGVPARISRMLARKWKFPEDKIISVLILLTLPVGLVWTGILMALAWVPFGLWAGLAVAALSVGSLLTSGASADSRRAYQERRRAHAAGLADSPRTLPLTREFHSFLSELDRLVRLGETPSEG